MAEYDNYQQELEPVRVNDAEQGKKYAYAVYILYLLNALFIGVPILTSVVGLIIAYCQKDRYKGTIYYSHFNNQVKLFFYVLGWSIVFVLLCFVMIGVPLLIGLYVWQLYRIISGLLKLSANESLDKTYSVKTL
ncbi:MAG: hypothetical protein GKC53_05645 [Neisseriaceae bacterium]|nr:MAG: hypothetical protein GKC53_05645 [Neisseriaceae bacterium]